MPIRSLLDLIRNLPTVRRQLRSLEKKRQRRQIAASPDPKAAFTTIYRQNVWGSRESVSGNGSTLASTEVFRAEFAALLTTLGIRSILDAPCGDFNWMRLVPLPPAHATPAPISSMRSSRSVVPAMPVRTGTSSCSTSSMTTIRPRISGSAGTR